MRKSLFFPFALLLASRPALAHHGVAAIGTGDPEGPGVALETTAALPLPKHTVFVLAKSEFASFQIRSDRTAFPAQKDFSSFNTFALGLGILPALSAYIFQPVNLKSIDAGVGRNAGLGDTNLMVAFGFKWDEGLRLVPPKESLDELLDWHFLLWASCALPTGGTERKDDQGKPFAPDMQLGFGTPSPAFGFAVLKQISPNLTWLGEANHQRFFAHAYSFTRYQFGTETRVNLAGSYRLYAKGSLRLDLAAEALGLRIGRDRERNSEGNLEALPGSGGTMVYGNLGLRFSLGRYAFALGARRAFAKSLNEESQQQGSEGLEKFRFTLAASMFGRPQP